MTHLKRLCLCLASLLLLGDHADAATLFVDNQSGSNAFNGQSAVAISRSAGPVKSITQALNLAGPGDTIVITNTGLPYYESLTLVGSRHSGYGVPFTIEGNGAVVSGARTISPAAWHEVGQLLWKFTPWRKGHYLLLQKNEPLPEVECPRGAESLPEIPQGHWCAWKGSIYYKSDLSAKPADLPLAYAQTQVGLTLFAVRDVQIRDLTFEHFRVDGVNAHNLCKNVVLDQVQSRENGRAGVVAKGSSKISLRNCKLARNREDSLLVFDQARADVAGTKLDE